MLIARAFDDLPRCTLAGRWQGEQKVTREADRAEAGKDLVDPHGGL